MNLIDKYTAMQAVQRIDSVATLRDGDPVIRMSAVEHVLENLPETGKNDGDGTSGDCISRTQAIEIVERYNKSHMVLKQQPMLGAASIVIELEELPSVQPERKTGHWVKSDMQRWYDVWLCSECGEKTDSAVMSKPRYKYCPMCGAKMEEGREDG